MFKPNNYDSAPSYDSEIVGLPAGGYVCQIKSASEKTTRTGSRQFEIMFDIVEGEHANHYMKLYRNSQARDKEKAKWAGTYRVFFADPQGNTSGMYKGLLTSIEKSNPGFHIDWAGSYDQFKNLKVGLLFRKEQYKSSWDGSVKTKVAPCAARPADVIRSGEFQIPADKLLADNPPMSTGDYTPVQVDTDDLPFD